MYCYKVLSTLHAPDYCQNVFISLNHKQSALAKTKLMQNNEFSDNFSRASVYNSRNVDAGVPACWS